MYSSSASIRSVYILCCDRFVTAVSGVALFWYTLAAAQYVSIYSLSYSSFSYSALRYSIHESVNNGVKNVAYSSSLLLFVHRSRLATVDILPGVAYYRLLSAFYMRLSYVQYAHLLVWDEPLRPEISSRPTTRYVYRPRYVQNSHLLRGTSTVLIASWT